MSTMVVELYEALTKAGVDEETAKNAAKVVLDTEILATKKDLAELKTDIIKWNTGTLLAATGLFAFIVKILGV